MLLTNDDTVALVIIYGAMLSLVSTRSSISSSSDNATHGVFALLLAGVCLVNGAQRNEVKKEKVLQFSMTNMISYIIFFYLQYFPGNRGGLHFFFFFFIKRCTFFCVTWKRVLKRIHSCVVQWLSVSRKVHYNRIILNIITWQLFLDKCRVNVSYNLLVHERTSQLPE